MKGRESVELAVYKEGDANTVQLAKALIRSASKRCARRCPSQTEIIPVYDQSNSSARRSARSASARGDRRPARRSSCCISSSATHARLISPASHPVSVIGTFMLMYLSGVTLNIMSFGGIALAVGMLVDTRSWFSRASPRSARPASEPRGRTFRDQRSIDCGDGRDADLGRGVLSDGVHLRHRRPAVQDQALTVTYSLHAVAARRPDGGADAGCRRIRRGRQHRATAPRPICARCRFVAAALWSRWPIHCQR